MSDEATVAPAEQSRDKDILAFFYDQVRNVEGLASSAGATIKGDSALAVTAIRTTLASARGQLDKVLSGEALTDEKKLEIVIQAVMAKYTPIIAAEIKSLLAAGTAIVVKEIAEAAGTAAVTA